MIIGGLAGRMASTLGLEGIEAVVFRPIGDQESLLPEEVLRLPGELARVDVLLRRPPNDRVQLIIRRLVISAAEIGLSRMTTKDRGV